MAQPPKEKPAAEKRKTASPSQLVTQLPSASSKSKATPLERPVSAAPAQREKQPPRSMQRSEAERPSFTYADLLRERRKGARRPLSTGNDRF